MTRSGARRSLSTWPTHAWFTRPNVGLMPIDPDVPAAALLETWQYLLAGIPDGWTRTGPGALAAVSGVALPTLNGVWVDSVDIDTAEYVNLIWTGWFEKLLSDGLLLVGVRWFVDPGGLRRGCRGPAFAEPLRVETVGVVEHALAGCDDLGVRPVVHAGRRE